MVIYFANGISYKSSFRFNYYSFLLYAVHLLLAVLLIDVERFVLPAFFFPPVFDLTREPLW